MEKGIELKLNAEYILAGDISYSMNHNDKACGGVTRYEYMLEKFKLFIKTAEDFDAEHGAPTIMLFGENVHTFEHCKLEHIDKELSRVNFEGMTNLDKLLDAAFDLHREEVIEKRNEGTEHPGTILIVFTDGDPSNKPAVKRSLERIVKSISTAEEFQIIFLIVGSVDAALEHYLNSLHDDLENERINPNDFDIIHVQPLEGTTFYGAVGAKDHD